LKNLAKKTNSAFIILEVPPTFQKTHKLIKILNFNAQKGQEAA